MKITDDMINAAMETVLNSANVPVWECMDASDVKQILEAALSAEGAVPVAYRHTLHMELGQTDVEVNTSEKHPFGRPNVDYSPEYRVTTEPLYPAPAVPSVVVKALEWKDMGNGAFESYAMGGALHYKVWKSWKNKWYSCASPDGTPFEKAQDAMGFAQADYEARIRSALSAQDQDVAGWERVTIETGRKSGTSHADVWPDGEGWEIATDRGRVNTPDAGWDRFSHHEELYFRRRTNDFPAAPAAKQGEGE